MRDFMMKRALADVWCSPFQDAQATLALSRMTRHGGARHSLMIQQSLVTLPTPREDYHIYQIGQNSPIRFALSLELGVWYRLADICVQQDKTIDLYTSKGILLCRSEAYLMLTHNQTFVLAIRLQPTIANLNHEQVYIRLYTNAYFSSERSDHLAKHIDYRGGVVVTNAEALTWQQGYRSYDNAQQGKALAFINGRLVHDFPPNSYRIGDRVEWFFDASIREVVDFPLSGLPSFLSELDSKQKYLLHSPKGLSQIDYHDDLSLYVIRKDGVKIDGVLLPRHTPDAIRQLTHRDYAIPVANVQSILEQNPTWATEQVFVRVYYRHSGYERPLIDEHQRIKELYRLNDSEIVQAMVGIDSTIAHWRASALEQSGYARVMSSMFGDVSPTQVMAMYGYNALAKMIGPTPLPVNNGNVVLPIGYVITSVAFEYDANGVLLGHYANANDGDQYNTHNTAATLVEFIEGVGSSDIGVLENFASVVRNPSLTQKVYACKIIEGIKDQQWFEVTGNPNYIQVVDNRLVWVGDNDRYAYQYKDDAKFSLLDLTFPADVANLAFDVYSGSPANILYLAPEKLDVWLNGHPLVENIDYYCQWPRITLCTKEYRDAVENKVTVRAIGFGGTNNERPIRGEYGFVQNGEVSLNNLYNTRNDRLMRCVVAGRLLPMSAVAFAEENHSVTMPSEFEGKPYWVDDYLVALRGIVDYNTYPMVMESRTMDERVSDYLNRKRPEHTHIALIPIVDKYKLYSPAMTQLLTDFKSGIVTAPLIAASVDTKQMLAEQYLSWLAVDPVRRKPHDEYTAIHPHPFETVLEIDAAQYAFCEWFNRYYLNNRLDLSYFVRIGTTPPIETNVDPYWDQVIYQLRMSAVSGNLVDDKAHPWFMSGAAALIADAEANDGVVLSLDTPGSVSTYENGAQAFTRSVAGSSFGSGDFTVEFRAKLTQDGIWEQGNFISNSGLDTDDTWEAPLVTWEIGVDWQPGVYIYVLDRNPSGNIVTMIESGETLVPDQWVDIAWVRKDGVSRLFVRGVNLTQTADAGLYPMSGDGVVDNNNYSDFFKLNFGQWQVPGSGWPIRGLTVDRLRITKAARYEANYDPTTVEFHVP